MRDLRNLSANPGPSLAFALGLTTFLPIGTQYVVLLAFAGLAVFSPPWRSQRTRIPGSWVALLVAFTLWPVITLLLNQPEGWGLRWLHSVRVGLCLALALGLSQKESASLLKGFVLGSVFSVTVILTDLWVVKLPPWPVWHQLLEVQGNASSQKWIALAAACGVSLGIGMGCHKSAHSRAPWLVWASILFLVTVSRAESRNAFLVATLMPAAAIVYRFRQTRFWVAGISAMIAGAFFIAFTSQTARMRFLLGWQEWEAFIYQGQFSGSVGARAHMYAVALQQMLSHPLLGTGLGSWEQVWAQVRPDLAVAAKYNNPHNDYLLWGMETGLPGLLLLSAILWALARRAWRRKTASGSGSWVITIALALTCALNAPFRDAALGMLLIVLAGGISDAAAEPDTHDEPRSD